MLKLVIKVSNSIFKRSIQIEILWCHLKNLIRDPIYGFCFQSQSRYHFIDNRWFLDSGIRSDTGSSMWPDWTLEMDSKSPRRVGVLTASDSETDSDRDKKGLISVMWTIIKDILPIMKSHKTDLFNALMTESISKLLPKMIMESKVVLLYQY